LHGGTHDGCCTVLLPLRHCRHRRSRDGDRGPQSRAFGVVPDPRLLQHRRLFILLGAEFLAFILVIVYVGAVAVLFLFVVMMLDVDFAELRQGMLTYMPVGATIGLILLVELALVLGTWTITPEALRLAAAPTPDAAVITNTEALGAILYTRYIYFFQAAGMILLVAMIGAIVLTLRHREGVRRQNIADQVARGRDAVEVRKVRPGRGYDMMKLMP
jgi:NADH-quinone oxidoreductase subunit J